ncbi:dr1-associated corepressor-like isoform X2 [Anneissia japonica]|uniref:dr1-associated corepressor-like isoform X1 n=1 Tax=Anneissia japonica TaxID=1529436 RepID=UPI0014259082|nr:dr1-associated corepressor-like isoform X1 [Anneissia japonica]XP_033105035.1 dr1-associated corepressor-like isoform X2 [Anneissia japonica]
MPSKKKKYNARFPPARIKKIMQTDEDIGKVSQAVPVLISKALEIFLEALVMKAHEKTKARNAKTMTKSHIKQCIENENKFDFLKDLVENVPDMPCEEEDTNSNETNLQEPKQTQSRRGRPPKRPLTDASASSSKNPRQSSEEASFSDDDSDDSGEETATSESHMNLVQNTRLKGSTEVKAIPSANMFQAVSSTSCSVGDNSLAMGFYQAPQTLQQNSNDDEDYDC